MRDPIPGPLGRLRDKFEKAEGQWRKVRCPECKNMIEYVPGDEWRGLLKCPHCGTRFKVPSLDGFVK